MLYTIEVTIADGVAERAAAADLNLDLAVAAITAVLNQEQIAAQAEIGVRISDDAELHQLNRTFRQVDAPTDVLSFANDATEGFVHSPESVPYLGDIAISLDRVLAQAAEYGHPPARELAYLAAHGALHLLGYDHEESPEAAAAMRTREEATMTALGLPRP